MKNGKEEAKKPEIGKPKRENHSSSGALAKDPSWFPCNAGSSLQRKKLIIYSANNTIPTIEYHSGWILRRYAPQDDAY